MGTRHRIGPKLGAALLAGTAVLLTAAGPAAAAGLWGADYFPNVPLVTHEGRTVHLYDDLLKGKSVAINVFYTSCKDECPLETARLVQVQRLLGGRVGRDVFFYSISIDPLRDTPEAMKAYAEKFGAGPGWLFLTGRPEDIRLVTRKLGLSRRNDPASKDGHAAVLMLGREPDGQWMRTSAVDNPRFLVATMASFFGWRELLPGTSYAEARPLELKDAAYFFQVHCGACHTIGGGDRIGPDLAGVTARRDRRWLARYLAEPDRMLAEGDPIATALFAKYKNVPMPNLGLTREQIAALLAYLEAASRQAPPSREAPAGGTASGAPAREPAAR
ncbi:MAG TPA: SCO family protein [Thermodesulfobacteriota bacterium]|nr:SCO family protein [Thermodesulfobacteriota bacterium]